MNNNEFNDIFIYVQAMKQIIRIAEGSGDNLTDDDIEIISERLFDPKEMYR